MKLRQTYGTHTTRGDLGYLPRAWFVKSIISASFDRFDSKVTLVFAVSAFNVIACASHAATPFACSLWIVFLFDISLRSWEVKTVSSNDSSGIRFRKSGRDLPK